MKLNYSFDKVHETRKLTSHEEVFLQGLAEYKFFLDKSLFFQIDDLQKHTELVLSGETETAYRYDYPDPDELEKEIEELEKMIKELEDMLRNGDMPQEYWALLEEYRKRLRKLMEARDEMEEDPDETRMSYTKTLLGKYEHKNGDDSRVTLYVNNIEAYAKNPYDTMLLMGQVLLHEYFHSFYYHVGIESEERIKYVEEPMAEFGSLVVLDSVASSGSPISIYADHALTYGLDFVKKKQSCEGLTAAYGFGAYLFDKHKDDYSDLIARYANLSRMLDKSDKMVLEYKYLVYPCYPFGLEEIAYEKLLPLLGGMPTTVVSARKEVSKSILCEFIKEVFIYLEDKREIDYLASYIDSKTAIGPKITLSSDIKGGMFKLPNIFYLIDCLATDPDFKPDRWFTDHEFVIEKKKYYLSSEWNGPETGSLRYSQFNYMIESVYHGSYKLMYVMTKL